jgi:hypothetical protein
MKVLKYAAGHVGGMPDLIFRTNRDGRHPHEFTAMPCWVKTDVALV